MSITRKFISTALLILAGASVVVAQARYKLLPPSNVQISGTSTVSNWVVKSQEVSGEMSFTPSAVKAGVLGSVVNAKVVLEVASIKSEKGETMDNKMYAALKHDEHPRITFLLSNPVEITAAPSTVRVTGDVELAGVKRPMIFDLKLVSPPGGNFHFQGSSSMNLSDFSIEPPTAMFGQIETGNAIVIQLDLIFGK